MGSFVYRLMGAALLDASIYENIESDRSAFWQAFVTVIVSSLAAGFGALGIFGHGFAIFAMTAGLALISWLAWAMLTLQIGGRFLPGPDTHADFAEMARTIGFAAAPGFLQVFAVFPRMTLPVFATTGLWMIAAMVVAVRQALDYRTTARAIVVCLLGLSLSIAMAIVIGLLFGPAAS